MSPGLSTEHENNTIGHTKCRLREVSRVHEAMGADGRRSSVPRLHDPDAAAHIIFEMRRWASLRQQTLWRTVEGMTKVHAALDAIADLQPGVNVQGMVKSKFQLLVAMQTYPKFMSSGGKAEREGMFADTEEMLTRSMTNRGCLQIAYLEEARNKFARLLCLIPNSKCARSCCA